MCCADLIGFVPRTHVQSVRAGAASLVRLEREKNNGAFRWTVQGVAA